MGFFTQSKKQEQQGRDLRISTADLACSKSRRATVPEPYAAAAAAEAEVLQLRSHILSLTSTFFEEKRAWLHVQQRQPQQRDSRSPSRSSSRCSSDPIEPPSAEPSECCCEVRADPGNGGGGKDVWGGRPSGGGSAGGGMGQLSGLSALPASHAREAEALKSSLQLVTQALSDGLSQWTLERSALLRELEEAGAALACQANVAAAKAAAAEDAGDCTPTRSARPLPAAAATVRRAAGSLVVTPSGDSLFDLPLPPLSGGGAAAGGASLCDLPLPPPLPLPLFPSAAVRTPDSMAAAAAGSSARRLSPATQALMDELRGENEALTMELVTAKMALAEACESGVVLSRALAKTRSQLLSEGGSAEGATA